MLSYRHAFHAGNHADVLKHLVQKDKPFQAIDTHAGTGCYELTSGYAAKSAEHDKQVAQQSDGFAVLKALPPLRRALVLMDPLYEEKQDYRRVVEALQEGLKRFATGTYAVWYPCLQREEAERLPDKLKRLPAKGWLHVALHVQTPSADGFGMHGSGMFVLNPPWTLHATLQQVMPKLLALLGQDAGARFVLEQQAV